MTTHTDTTTILDQFRGAAKQPLAAALGALLGGFVPLATYMIAHHELGSPASYMLVSGGLLFSAKTVWQWARQAFSDGWKASGFVLLLEGVMVLSVEAWLAQSALAYLVAINAVATGCTIAEKRRPVRTTIAATRIRPKARDKRIASTVN